MPRSKTRLPFVALALLAVPGLAAAQSMTPQPRPAATPVVLGSTVTAAIGQHTAAAVRQGARTALAAAPPEDSAVNLRPAGTAEVR